MTDKLIKSKSDVKVLDSHREVLRGLYIWTNKAPGLAAHPDWCFAKCLVCHGSTEAVLKCKQVEPHGNEEEFTIPAAYAFNCNSTIDPLQYGDIGMIPHANPASALDFLKQRYEASQIYTEARPLLVAINPFKDLKNCTDDDIRRYRDAPEIDKLPPHVFAISRLALDNLQGVRKSQTIVVSGESGAGKTEASKQILRYFAKASSTRSDTRIQTAVLAANPVLEAFGNAKTVRNNNSSRFGRFTMLQMANGGGIQYGKIRGFLLEKSRIIQQADDERNYHIFYQLIKGASAKEKREFGLRGLNDYRYLMSKCHVAPGVDDLEEWEDVQKSFVSMKISQENVTSIFRILSGILLLGNVEIQAVQAKGLFDASFIDDKNSKILREACSLLALDPAKVKDALEIKITTAGKQQQIGAWPQAEAIISKDSLAKGIYDKLFEWIVKELNSTIEPPQGEFKEFMALLDIFGFEVFENNSLEQLFINITNERLQKNFTDTVFEREQKLYRQEKIRIPEINFTSNEKLIDMLIGKGSLLSILEDQCITASGNDKKFVSAASASLKSNPNYIESKVNSTETFKVLHTIGEISYSAVGFVFKNKDVLRAELVELIQESADPVTSDIYRGIVVQKGKLPKGLFIGSQVITQLADMTEVLNQSELHFIRCVKPNQSKTPMLFNASVVLKQLYSLSILEALQLRKLGFSYRRPFEEFVRQWGVINLGISNDKTISAREAAQRLIACADINKKDFAFGTTMVFLTSAANKQILQKSQEAASSCAPLVDIIEAMVLRNRYRKDYDEKQRKPITRFQAHCRRLLHGKVASPMHAVNVCGWK